MRFGADRDRDLRDQDWAEETCASGVIVGRRVRLPWFTWEGLACVLVLVTLCVLFGDDEPVQDSGTVTLSGHGGLVETVRFSPDGETLVTSCWDRTLKLWSTGGPPEALGREVASLPGDAENYLAVFSPDGGTVAAAGLDGLTIWNWRDPRSFPEAQDPVRLVPCGGVRPRRPQPGGWRLRQADPHLGPERTTACSAC